MTQCAEGGVNDLYETGRYLVDLGAVLAFDMTFECITAKLSYLLGKKYPIVKIKEMMMMNLNGELTDLKKDNKAFTLKNTQMVEAVT